MSKSPRSLSGWHKLRWAVLLRDNFTCQYCGQAAPNVPLEADHKIPVCEGGTDDMDNLVASCWACNRGKNGLRQSIVLARGREVNRQRKIKDRTMVVPAPLRDEVLDTLLSRGPMSAQDIATKLGRSLNSTQVMLWRLKKRNLIVRLGLNLYGAKAKD